MSVLTIELEDMKSGSHRASGSFSPTELEFADPSEFVFEGGMELDVRLNTIDWLTFYVHGQLVYRASGECRRCLKPAAQDRNLEIRGVLALPEGLDSLELSDEERELQGIFPLDPDEKKIDLSVLVRESVVLDYPRFLECSLDCKGLCPGCGANLNEKTCNCGSHQTDTRWAKLYELKKKTN